MPWPTPNRTPPIGKRSVLLYEIRKAVLHWNIPQDEAAKRLGLTRPRTNDVLCGKLSKFSLDALVNIAVRQQRIE